MQVAAPSPCGPDSSDLLAWPCWTRSPAGKPPAKPVAAQKVSRRQGFALASVRSPEPGAARPGQSTAEVVGHLASLAKPSRRPPRLAAGSLTGPLTAGQCLTIARLTDPAKWLVPHHLPGTLRPRPPPDSSALICCAYLALHCAGCTDSAHSVPFQSATQFKQPRLAKAMAVVPVRQTKPAPIRALRSPDLQQHGGKRWQSARTSSLRSSRGSNRRCTPVLADRARRQRGQSKTSRPRDFVRPRQAIDASIGPVPPLTAPASGSGRPSRRWLRGGILVRSVGNRPAQPALTYAPVTRLQPCWLFRATANSPESLSHAAAFARHRESGKTSRPRDFVRPPKYYGARRCLSPRTQQ